MKIVLPYCYNLIVIFLIDIDEEGWETVQRGRLRARQSPCQKSTENLAPNIRSAKRNLIRSLSVPDKANVKGQKDKQPAPSQKSLRAVSERHLPASEYPTLERAHSKDSEKENIPVNVGSSIESIVSHTNTDSSATLTFGSSVTPAKSIGSSHLTSSDDINIKDSLELDLEKVSNFQPLICCF